MGGDVFGGKSGAEFFVEVDDAVASGTELDGGEVVFAEGVGDEAADRGDGTAAEHKGCPGTNDAADGIAHGLNLTVEDFFFGGEVMFEAEVAGDRVGVVEGLGGLDEGDGGVLEEADGALEEVAGGDEVGVEADNQFGGGLADRVVEVASFGVAVVGAGDVFAAEGRSKVADVGALGVVEQIDLEVGIVEGLDADDGALEDEGGCVVGGDEDVDVGLVAAFEYVGGKLVGLGKAMITRRSPIIADLK